jgi:hypothetical protein
VEPISKITAAKRLWRADDLASDPVSLILWRASLLLLPVSLATLVIAPIAVGAWFLHREVISGSTFAALVAVGLLPSILRHALRVRLALRRQFWTRKGIPVTRDVEPRRFWFWTGVEFLAGVVVPTAAAGYLLFTAASLA